MGYDAECVQCTIEKNYKLIEQETDTEKRNAFMNYVLDTIRNCPAQSGPTIEAVRITQYYEKLFGKRKDLSNLKKEFNDLMLEREKECEALIQHAPDPLETALKLSRSGNYIDTSAVKNVNSGKLDDLLHRAVNERLDPEEYRHFQSDLKRAGHFVLLCDNTGEIVLDKLLVHTIREQYPDMEVTVIVRGMPVSNDATLEDAVYVGMTEEARVIGNGTAYGGTRLDELSADAAEAICQADLILAKGQGNVETLVGCGRNIYYLFLCKCKWFTRKFGLDAFTGVFANEQRMKAL